MFFNANPCNKPTAQACCNYGVKGVIPFEALHDQILRRIFDENGDRRYCTRITAAEDRSLVYEKTRYNGRPVNQISVDGEGRIIETEGPELLAFLQKNGVRITYGFAPDRYEMP